MEFCNSPTYHAKYNVSDSNGVKLNLTAKEVCKISEKRESPLTVTGYFNSKLSTHKLRFIDTPGVNSSLNPIHKQITRDELLSHLRMGHVQQQSQKSRMMMMTPLKQMRMTAIETK